MRESPGGGSGRAAAASRAFLQICRSPLASARTPLKQPHHPSRQQVWHLRRSVHICCVLLVIPVLCLLMLSLFLLARPPSINLHSCTCCTVNSLCTPPRRTYACGHCCNVPYTGLLCFPRSIAPTFLHCLLPKTTTRPVASPTTLAACTAAASGCGTVTPTWHTYPSPVHLRFIRPQQTRAHELVSSSKSDLQTKLQELKQELLNLRVAKITGGNSSKLVKMCVHCDQRACGAVAMPLGPQWHIRPRGL